jgi:hypothetical protein
LPFEALYGYNPRTLLTLAAQTGIPKASVFMHQLKSQIEGATDALLEAQLCQAEAHTGLTVSLKAGNLVLLSSKDLHPAYPTELTP